MSDLGPRLGEGASLAAPTAPHATPPGPRRRRDRSGPERFWRSVRTRVVLAVIASIGLHYAIGPWSLLPDESIELKDTQGELTIPIDVLSGGLEEEAPPAPPPDMTPASPAAEGEGASDAGVRRPNAKDGGAQDADGGLDAGVPKKKKPKHHDGDLSAEDDLDGGLATNAGDAGKAGGLARDTVGAVGALGKVQAGPQNVVLVLNVAEARKNGLLAQLGPFLKVLPQWRDFLEGIDVEPMQVASWVSLNGPSLINTERDAILVGYTISDVIVDGIVDEIAKKSPNGGLIDVGVPGVRAANGYGDRAARVFLRPRSHLLAVVPPDYAPTAARLLKDIRSAPPLRPKEIVYFKILRPKGAIPMLPECLEELRFSVKGASDDGLDATGEGECGTAAQAAKAATEIEKRVIGLNSLGVRLITRGLLNDVTVGSDGSRVKIHLPIERGQLEALMALLAGRLGVDWQPPSMRRPTPPSSPSTATP